MIITCRNCSTSFNLDESLLKKEGSKVSCCICEYIFKAYPPAQRSDQTAFNGFGHDSRYELKHKLNLDSGGPNLELETIEDLLLVLDLPELEIETPEFDLDEQPVSQEGEFSLELENDMAGDVLFEQLEKGEMAPPAPTDSSFTREEVSHGEFSLDDEPADADDFALDEEIVGEFEFEHESGGELTLDDEPVEDFEIEKIPATVSNQNEPVSRFGDLENSSEPLGAEYGKDIQEETTGPDIKKIALIAASALIFIMGSVYLASLTTGFKIPLVQPTIDKLFKGKKGGTKSLKVALDEASVGDRPIKRGKIGDLYVISGNIVNYSSVPVNYVKVRASLITQDNKTAKTKEVYCGNILPDKELARKGISDIDKMMVNKAGQKNMNLNIVPDKKVPFEVVFTDLPDNLAFYKVEVVDFKAGG